ncbi:MAG: c-type cytochrome biogenesis protein CcmI [Burkholderiales bacterium]|nr:c-type cytochrome biogenesis protein CcmI [Burkholderiales bacterium]
MITFWIVAGAMMLAVVALLAVPLARRATHASGVDQDRSNIALFQDQLAELERDRDQGIVSPEQFVQARIELSQRLLADVPAHGTAEAARPAAASGAWRYAAIACVPVVAILAYLVLGTPDAIDPRVAKGLGGGPDHAQNMQNLGELAERLAARLAAKPDDAEAWVLLARSYQMLGRAPEAVKAFAHAIELVPDSAQLYADYADMQVASAGGEWTPGALAAIKQALTLDPKHPKTLWLAGSEAHARRDFATALRYWETLLPAVEPGSEVERIIRGNIAEARALIAGAPPPAPAATERAPKATAEAAAVAGALSGTVALDPKFAAQVKPTDTVFVFARAAEGPKMPLAIRRISVQELPYRFSLDDSTAMSAGMTISKFDRVVVGARVSRGGDAAPRPGDLEGFSAPVKPGTGGIEVRIDARID